MTMVVQLLLQGASTGQIIKFGFDNWGIKKRTVDDYISKCKDRVKQIANKDVELELAKAKIRYEDLYFKNYKSMDWRECRTVQGDINKLFGINAPEKQDVTSKGERIGRGPLMFISADKFTDEQLQEIINKKLGDNYNV